MRQCDKYKYPHSRSCRYRQEWRDRHKAQDYFVHRNSELIRLYGITKRDYEKMLLHQKGKCSICKTDFNGKRPMAVDHDHQSGKVRGLLCNRCNFGISWFEKYERQANKYLARS